MGIFVVILIVCVILINAILSCYRYNSNVKRIFQSKKDLTLKDISLFSNYQLVKFIKRRLSKRTGSLKIFYFEDKCVTFYSSDNDLKILEKLDIIQEYLKLTKVKNVHKLPDFDFIDDKILELWTKYGDKCAYRSIVKRQMDKMLDTYELSNSSYNEMRRRFLGVRNYYSRGRIS